MPRPPSTRPATPPAPSAPTSENPPDVASAHGPRTAHVGAEPPDQGLFHDQGAIKSDRGGQPPVQRTQIGESDRGVAPPPMTVPVASWAGSRRPAPVPLAARSPEAQAAHAAREARKAADEAARAQEAALTRPVPLAPRERLAAVHMIQRMMVAGDEIVVAELAEELEVHEDHVRSMVARAKRGLLTNSEERAAAIEIWRTRVEHGIQTAIRGGSEALSPLTALLALQAKQGGYFPLKPTKGVGHGNVEGAGTSRELTDEEVLAEAERIAEGARAKIAARGER